MIPTDKIVSERLGVAFVHIYMGEPVVLGANKFKVGYFSQVISSEIPHVHAWSFAKQLY